MTYGAKADYKSGGREPTDYVNSRLMIMWGWSPGDGTFGTGTLQYLKLAKKHGMRIICVDPRRTRTSYELADEHVFIRPSTDAAALIAMAYVIVTEGLHDQAFLDRHVLGFDEAHLPPGAPADASYRSYLLGLADGVRKTPEWAASHHRHAGRHASAAWPSSSPPPSRRRSTAATRRGARSTASSSTARPTRSRAITGNVGTPGGNSGTSNGATGRGGIKSLPFGPNPTNARVATPLLADLLARGKAGGYPADIKMIYSVARRSLQPGAQRGQERGRRRAARVHRGARPLRHADRAVRRHPAAGHHVLGAQRRAHAVGRRRPLRALHAAGHRHRWTSAATTSTSAPTWPAGSGSRATTTRPKSEWLRELTKDTIDDFDTFRSRGLARLPAPDDAVAFARQIRDPESHPFTTPSGKIEIYSMAIAANPDPVRARGDPTDSDVDSRPERDGIRCGWSRPKSRARTHSIHDNQPILSRADRDDVWINTADAAARGIVDGQSVRVFNERGATVLPARVTDRIAPGCVSIKEGAWFTPDAHGQDTHGCANVLTGDRASPAAAAAFNSTFVEIASA